MRVSVVSLNGLQELSGGGLYLRSLVRALIATDIADKITVISKKILAQDIAFEHDQVQEIALEKGLTQDVFARILLHPTFLGVYTNIIVDACQGSDLIIVHNSRCGLILRKIKHHFPNVPIIMVSDNIEADLMLQTQQGKKRRNRIQALLEQFEIRRAERYCKYADAVSFITRSDLDLFEKMYGKPVVTAVLPVTVNTALPFDKNSAIGVSMKVLFTGHFGFQPNIDALQILLKVAETLQSTQSNFDVKFVVAGANLDRLPTPALSNVVYRTSPTISEMDKLFREASCYIAPVLWGSGMKTKVAEALSYGLPVVALPNASVGYEELLADPSFASALHVAVDVPGLVQRLQDMQDKDTLAKARLIAFQAYQRWYSDAAQSRRLIALFERLRLIRTLCY